MTLTDLTLSKGQNYMYVNSNGTPFENGEAVRSAYNKATFSQPNGKPLSRTNRFTILLAPGIYSLSTSRLTFNQDFIDVVGIAGSKDTIITSPVYDDYDFWSIYNADGTGYNTNGSYSGDTMLTQFGQTKITVPGGGWHPGNYIYPDGISGAVRNAAFFDSDSDHCLILLLATDAKIKGISVGNIKHGASSANLTFEDVNAGSFSITTVGYQGSSAKLIDCKLGYNCCTGGANGTYINCTNRTTKVGNSITGFIYTPEKLIFQQSNGLFVNCIMQDIVPQFATDTYNYQFHNPAGMFIGCKAGAQSFGGRNNTYSGSLSFVNAVPTDTRVNTATNSASVATGKFIGCVAGIESFGGGSGATSGTFLSCIAGSGSFGEIGSRTGIAAATVKNNAILV